MSERPGHSTSSPERVLERGIERPGAYYPTRACALAMHPGALRRGEQLVVIDGRFWIERPVRPGERGGVSDA